MAVRTSDADVAFVTGVVGRSDRRSDDLGDNGGLSRSVGALDQKIGEGLVSTLSRELAADLARSVLDALVGRAGIYPAAIADAVLGRVSRID